MENDYKQLKQELIDTLTGDARFDLLSRTIYSTDASIYEMAPIGVVYPKTLDDVTATVNICRKHGVSVTPRGAGTGLTGGAVGPGIQIDFSHYMVWTKELDVRPEGGSVRVGPGVVLDELNAEIASTGLHFAPDVATGNRATFGGMIANNSCGAHSIIFGRVVDHIIELETVLADGSVAYWNREGLCKGADYPDPSPLALQCEAELKRVAEEYRDDIKERYPKVMRSNGGYALDRLIAPDKGIDPVGLLSGSEGTLCLVTDAVVKLVPTPKIKGVVVVHFSDLIESLKAVPIILNTYHPAAIELVDKMILDAARTNPAMMARGHFLQGDPCALLLVEFYCDDEKELQSKIDVMVKGLEKDGIGYACVPVTEPKKQTDVWEMRKAGVGLLMSKPGESQPYALIEDAAVPTEVLWEYIQEMNDFLTSEGVHEVGHYAHASVGCLHVRPVLNLRKMEDVDRMYRIGDGVSSIVLKYGGTMTGEHGDGMIRSQWLEKLYGKRILQAFRELKEAFDPEEIMNPGKIVDPWPMTENLRYGANYEATPVKTTYDFSAWGGLSGLASMCSGVGQCRQKLVDTMCPSYRATGDELHATRARANAMRIALSNRGLIKGLDDPFLEEVFDLCLSCKACQTECPTGVDVSKLKAEWLAHKNRTKGVPLRSRLVASTCTMAWMGNLFAPISNLFLKSMLVRWVFEKLAGFDMNVPMPQYHWGTFQLWFKKHRWKVRNKPFPQGKVVYYVDTWTNYYVPNIGKSTVKLLEAAGFEVIAPEHVCCGRPLMSKGMLDQVKGMAKSNVETFLPYAKAGIPILGSEPSCVSALVDDYPKMLVNEDAKTVASMTRTAEDFLADFLEEHPDAIKFNDKKIKLLYHCHCHQKALYGTEGVAKLIRAFPNVEGSEIPSGCCGMAGSFGHEKEHVEVSKKVGELVLFPAVRNRGDAQIAVEGFSCRHQIHTHTGAETKHILEYLAEAVE